MATVQTQRNKDVEGEFEPTEADVKTRATHIYNQRCQTGEVGDPDSDWDEAKGQLKAEELKLRELTRAQEIHAIHWEHPWSVDTDPKEEEEVRSRFRESLEASRGVER